MRESYLPLRTHPAVVKGGLNELQSEAWNWWDSSSWVRANPTLPGAFVMEDLSRT